MPYRSSPYSRLPALQTPVPGAMGALRVGVIALLVLAFLTGGGSYDRGWGDAMVELLAWPVLGLGLFVHVRSGISRPMGALLLGAATVPGWLAAQWLLGLSNAPWETERALWFVMPGVALWVAVLALPARLDRGLLWWLSGLIGLNVLFAFVQLGAPQESLLNPFPEWSPALGGVFANPNHHATVLTIAMLWLVAWMWNDWHHTRQEVPTGRQYLKWLGAGAGALLAMAALPLTGSRAMVLIALAALLAVPVLLGGLLQELRGRGRRRRSVVLGLALGGGAAMLAVAVMGWFQVDGETESRGALASATAALAMDAMPAGIGVGGFVPWFDAHAPAQLAQYEYVNHAHNEYAQWALESGVAGLLWIAALVAWALWAAPFRRNEASRELAPHVTGWLGVMVVLAHSVVDYPLRTQSVTAVTVLLAAMATVAAIKRRASPNPEKIPTAHSATELA